MVGRQGAWAVLVPAMLFVCAVASAQDAKSAPQDRRWGLTFAYPGGGAQIGLIWQTSDRTAIRPEFTFSGRFVSASGANPSNSYGVGAIVTVLRYVARKEGVSLYVGPRFTYARSWTGSGPDAYATMNYGAGATGGLQYDVTKRISVFGESGVGYAFADSNQYASGTHSISTRSALGVNFYF